MPLAEARAIAPHLNTRLADPQGDAAALQQLARWFVRYSPLVSVDGLDGITIDATGCAHLFGGEEAMLSDISMRLERAGIYACISMAGSIGAAWAMAHYYGQNTVVQPGDDQAIISPLPVSALRLDKKTILSLNRLGLGTIGSLLTLSRPALARRFRGARSKQVADLLDQIDKVVGKKAEPIAPLQPLPSWQVRQAFLEPISTPESIEKAVQALVADLAIILQQSSLGVRKMTAVAYRVDGTVSSCSVGTSRPNRDPDHLMELISEKLAYIDAGFGIDLLLLKALETEALAPYQLGDERQSSLKSAMELMDRLTARLGDRAISRLSHHQSHIPEQAQHLVAATNQNLHWKEYPTTSLCLHRPLRLLLRPEIVDVLAEVPEGPPRRFRWRRVLHQVMKAEGPERVAPEWWHTPHGYSRDYYRIEVESGARFWLFRHGLYDVPGVRPAEAVVPQWYMHGLFP